ncbi:MAG: DNA primase [Pelotomaculum sp. PtaB.Bin117]|nr:MAG: DNA primase [Pelotomaculum sp. PtaB.Bin117]
MVKKLPFIEVARRYLPGELRQQGSRWVTCCPFHEDHSPSLVLYPDSNSWYCYGCSKGGSNIDLVMQALNIDNPKEAVRLLAADFGVILPDTTKEERAKFKQINLQLKARRELETRFKVKENEIYQRLSAVYRAVDNKLAGIKSEDDIEHLGGLYHIEPILEHVLETLRTGTIAEKVAVLKSDRVKRWCKR